MAIKVNVIEQAHGVKFESSALNGLRGLAALDVLVFHSIEYSKFNFTTYGTVRIHCYISSIELNIKCQHFYIGLVTSSGLSIFFVD